MSQNTFHVPTKQDEHIPAKPEQTEFAILEALHRKLNKRNITHLLEDLSISVWFALVGFVPSPLILNERLVLSLCGIQLGKFI